MPGALREHALALRRCFLAQNTREWKARNTIYLELQKTAAASGCCAQGGHLHVGVCASVATDLSTQGSEYNAPAASQYRRRLEKDIVL